MSGYRAQSDWYRNMRTSPSTTVYPRHPVLRPMWVIMRQRWPSSNPRCQRYRYRGRVNANFSSPVGLDGARTVMVFLLLHGRNSVHAPYEAFSLSSGSFSVRNVVLRAYLTSERYGPLSRIRPGWHYRPSATRGEPDGQTRRERLPASAR